MSSKTSKTEQARQLTGRQHRDAIEPLRSAILIAKWDAKSYDDPTVTRVWWPKSEYPTLEAASDALRAAGLPAGLDFTQYGSGRYDFADLRDIVASGQADAAEQADGIARKPAAKKATPKAAKPAGDGLRYPEGIKRCPRCTETKPRSEFASNRSAKDGAFSICKDCERIDRKRRAEAKKAAEATPKARSRKATVSPKPTPRATPGSRTRKPTA